jgi:putative ABC transport system permease protein
VVAIQVAIGADYFKAIGLPVLRGREFSADEAEGTVNRRVVIIDEFLAQRLFPAPGDNPVGQFIRVSGDGGPAGPPLQIVGLVPGVRSDLLRFRTTPHVYLPYPARPRAWMTYHVRPAAGGPASPALLRTLRGAIRAYDERLPVLGMTTLEEFAARSTSVWMLRSAARVFSAFALAGLFAAVVGIYGVNAYAVARRTREIGIRIAVGASGQDIARLVLRDAFVVVAAGTAAGLLLAIALGTLVRSWLFGVAMLDPAAWLVSALVLGTAATVASYLPARRAVRMDPIAALRHE